MSTRLKGNRIFICLFFCFILCYVKSQPLFAVELERYRVSWDHPYPQMVYSTDYYDGKVLDSILASLNITGLDERHFTAEEMAEDDNNVLGTVVQSMPFTNTFTYNTFSTPNSKGISFETKLSNNATFNMTYYVNDIEDIYIPIPRPADDLNCTIIRQRKSKQNCSCDSEKEIKKDSVKFSFIVKNWPFTPVAPGIVNRFVGLGLVVRVPVNLSYYIANPDSDQTLNFPTCHVADYNLLLNYDVYYRMSTVQYMIADGTTIKKVNTVNPPMTTFNFSDYEKTGLATVPFWALLSEFEEIAEYDPDISFLFGGTLNDELPDEQGGDGGDNGDSADADLIVGLVVGLVGGVILIAIIIIVVLLFLGWKKNKFVRNQLDTFTKTYSE